MQRRQYQESPDLRDYANDMSRTAERWDRIFDLAERQSKVAPEPVSPVVPRVEEKDPRHRNGG